MKTLALALAVLAISGSAASANGRFELPDAQPPAKAYSPARAEWSTIGA